MGRVPSLLDYAIATRDAKSEHAEAVAAAKADPRDPYGFRALLASIHRPVKLDPELDTLLDTLDDAIPADDEPVLISANDNLDDAPAELPGLVTTAPASLPSPAPRPGASRVPELVTKGRPSPRAQKRRSGLRSKEDARRMRAHGRRAEGEVVKHLPPPPTPTDSNKTKPENSAKTSARATTTITTGPTYRRGIASWDEAGELPRIISINRALAEFGEPFAFSLNLDPKLIRRGISDARGLLDYVRRRIALNLKRALARAVTMWVVIETDEHGRPHLHGGIATNDNDRPDVIEEAIAKAGGNWTRQGSAPADVRRQWEPDGWAAYPLKRIERTRQHLRDLAGLGPGAHVGIYAVTNDLRAAGERIHAEERKRIGRR